MQLYAQIAKQMSYGKWNDIARQFAVEQARHLPGGGLHDIDPWPERFVSVNQLRKAYSRFLEKEEKKRQKAAEGLLELARGSAEIRMQEQQNDNVQHPQNSNLQLLDENFITIPEGSILLRDGRILFISGTVIQMEKEKKRQKAAEGLLELARGSAEIRMQEQQNDNVQHPQGSNLQLFDENFITIPEGSILLQDGRILLTSGTVIRSSGYSPNMEPSHYNIQFLESAVPIPQGSRLLPNGRMHLRTILPRISSPGREPNS
ncbi:hypothetical protein NHQ30_006425 [Ciborinia camelliae]|nr:hypothetical protein NHQ30_006425 [Ciborinia camelliae]